MRPVFATALFNSWTEWFHFLKLKCWACNLALRQTKCFGNSPGKINTAGLRLVFRGPTFKPSHAIVIDSHQPFDIYVFFTNWLQGFSAKHFPLISCENSHWWNIMVSHHAAWIQHCVNQSLVIQLYQPVTSNYWKVRVSRTMAHTCPGHRTK